MAASDLPPEARGEAEARRRSANCSSGKPFREMAATLRAVDKNRHGQRLVRKTATRSTSHPYARIWVLQCGACGMTYGSNSCDAHIRRCPTCHPKAAPGESLERF